MDRESRPRQTPPSHGLSRSAPHDRPQCTRAPVREPRFNGVRTSRGKR
ncbi:Uncharacterised protein [Amycolatopsis camponoti]|uniref:Uncharacterized protein n=1 Tax=Amycolatopsis camponoti TaxID=2606593 RepID=A0A6I8LFW8_9PSEU|nr:Uncharacterised protein [Amycolatopsis camponoti]